MDIIKKSDLIASVSQRWDQQYKNTTWRDKIEIGCRLRVEILQTEEQIYNIIGNYTWTENICDECGKDREVVIQIGEEPHYESSTVFICPECLKKAMDLIEKIK